MQAADLRIDLFARIAVVHLLGHVPKHLRVLDLGRNFLHRVDPGLDAFELADDLVRDVLVVPEPGFTHLGFELLEPQGLFFNVHRVSHRRDALLDLFEDAGDIFVLHRAEDCTAAWLSR